MPLRLRHAQFVTLVALAIARRPRTRRRAWLALAGCVVVVAGAVSMPILAFVVPLGAVHPGPFFGAAIALASRALVAAPGMAYAVPGAVWVLDGIWPRAARRVALLDRSARRTSVGA
jgi:hypothetical protein